VTIDSELQPLLSVFSTSAANKLTLSAKSAERQINGRSQKQFRGDLRFREGFCIEFCQIFLQFMAFLTVK